MSWVDPAQELAAIRRWFDARDLELELFERSDGRIIWQQRVRRGRRRARGGACRPAPPLDQATAGGTVGAVAGRPERGGAAAGGRDADLPDTGWPQQSGPAGGPGLGG